MQKKKRKLTFRRSGGRAEEENPEKRSPFLLPFTTLMSVSPYKVHLVKLTAVGIFCFQALSCATRSDGDTFQRSLTVPEDIFPLPHCSPEGKARGSSPEPDCLCDENWQQENKAILQSRWQVIKGKTAGASRTQGTQSETKWHWYQHLGNERGR